MSVLRFQVRMRSAGFGLLQSIFLEKSTQKGKMEEKKAKLAREWKALSRGEIFIMADDTTTHRPRKRSARFSKDLDITQAMADYDRTPETPPAYTTSHKRKVHMLQLTLFIGANWYAAGLMNSDVPVKLLALLKVFPVFVMILIALALGKSNTYGVRVALGLALCAVGNVCFELDGLSPEHVPIFLIGMGFFVAGLCTFSCAFSANHISLSAATSAPPVAYAAVVFNVLRPTVPITLLVPVLTYAAVIAALMLLAFSRQPEGFSSLWSWRCASAGAMLFAATSSILGYDRFVAAVPHAKLIFMACYYLAQYMITMSVKGAQARKLSQALGSVEDFRKMQGFRTES